MQFGQKGQSVLEKQKAACYPRENSVFIPNWRKKSGIGPY
jgi:hypothetical protein